MLFKIRGSDLIIIFHCMTVHGCNLKGGGEGNKVPAALSMCGWNCKDLKCFEGLSGSD